MKVDLEIAFKKLGKEDALILDIELIYLLKVFKTIQYITFNNVTRLELNVGFYNRVSEENKYVFMGIFHEMEFHVILQLILFCLLIENSLVLNSKHIVWDHKCSRFRENGMSGLIHLGRQT